MAFITGFGGIEISAEKLEPFPHRCSVDSSTETESLTDALTFARTEDVIKEVKSHLKDYWSSLGPGCY